MHRTGVLGSLGINRIRQVYEKREKTRIKQKGCYG
jgi:hypothetical protein